MPTIPPEIAEQVPALAVLVGLVLFAGLLIYKIARRLLDLMDDTLAKNTEALGSNTEVSRQTQQVLGSAKDQMRSTASVMKEVKEYLIRLNGNGPRR